MTDLRIPYMVTGSVVSSLQGQPRATHDIDVVVLLDKRAIHPLREAFTKEQFYSSETGMEEAITHRTMFNLIDGRSGNKVDFWLLTDDTFDQTRFARRKKATVFGLDNLFVTTPEDTIISKLRWANLAGGSEKQLTDAVRVFEMQFDRLDTTYINQWVNALGLQTEWKQLINQAEPY